MARIRTIKPEFWDSPGTETLHPYWRLLYIAMWNWADDTGRGKAEARELMGFAFPRDEQMTSAEFRRGLGEVRRVFGVVFYKVDGRSFYAIPAWDKHQKIDKRSGSRWPAPEDGEPYDPAGNEQVKGTFGGDSAEPAEDTSNIRRELGAGTGEQGNRGTGEEVPEFSKNASVSNAREKSDDPLDEPIPPPPAVQDEPRSQPTTATLARLVNAYAAKVKPCDRTKILAHLTNATADWDIETIAKAMENLALDHRAVTADTLRIELNNAGCNKAGIQYFQDGSHVDWNTGILRTKSGGIIGGGGYRSGKTLWRE